MRVLRMGALLLLCLGGSEQSRVRIECCDLWFTLNRYIQTHAGVDRSACVPGDCVQTGQIESFMSETNAVLHDRLRFEGSAIVMDVSNNSTLQNILVWSYLGRHFTSTRQQQVQDDLYFEFNVATRTMTLRKVQCEFQKHIYESVIVLVVLVLIFVLSSRMLHTVLDEYKSKHAVVAASPAIPIHAASFNIRYRALPTQVLGL